MISEEAIQLRKEFFQFNKRKEKVLKKLEEKERKLKESCTHELTVVTQYYYNGSYSHDSDDWHPEERECLICGYVELGKKEIYGSKYTSFEVLKKPKYRMMCSCLPKNYQKVPIKDLFSFIEKYCKEEI